MWDDDDLNNRPLGKYLESNVKEFQKRLFRFQRQYGHISPICPILGWLAPPPLRHLTPVLDRNVPEVHTQLSWSLSKTASICTQQAMQFVNLTMDQHFWKKYPPRTFSNGIWRIKQLNSAKLGRARNLGVTSPFTAHQHFCLPLAYHMSHPWRWIISPWFSVH